MKLSFMLSVFLAASPLAFCPLGFPTEQACPQESPSCALFTDENGNGFCDNPEPVVVEETEADPEEPQLPDSAATIVESPEEQPVEEAQPPDTAVIEEQPEPVVIELEQVDPPVVLPENPPDGQAEQIEEPALADSVPVELVPCPLGYTPAEACPIDNPGCLFFRDPNGDGFCDNPLLCEAANTVLDPDTVIVFSHPDIDCPLGFTPEEACSLGVPNCTLFADFDESSFCDNPDSSASGILRSSEAGWENLGCPLDLDPEQACHHSLPLCPHWFGVTEGTFCSSPLGGTRRLWTMFIGLILLLPISRILSRRLRGRRVNERMARQKAHMIISAVSIMVLGIAVQGCFCPLGAFQYLFIPGGLAFLGVLGVIILILPILQSMFCGRVFCAWVCPIGGLQEFLFRIHVPGQFSPGGRVHSILLWLKYVFLVGLVAWLIFGSSAKAGQWEAFFCRYDPFRTVFTLFVSGSLIIAGVMILLAIFIRRFFCRYLCFYGALLSIFNRARLLTRFKKRPVSPVKEEAEIDSDDEFDR